MHIKKFAVQLNVHIPTFIDLLEIDVEPEIWLDDSLEIIEDDRLFKIIDEGWEFEFFGQAPAVPRIGEEWHNTPAFEELFTELVESNMKVFGGLVEEDQMGLTTLLTYPWRVENVRWLNHNLKGEQIEFSLPYVSCSAQW